MPAGICPGGIADVNVFTDISTTFVKDVGTGLFEPFSGSGIVLLEEVCGGQNNIQATFDDGASTTVGDSCDSDPAISGSVKPLEPLSDFNGAANSPSGTWTLKVIDFAHFDLTKLNNWELQLECIPQLSIAKVTDGAEPSTNGQFQVTVNPVHNTGAAITGTVTYSGTAVNGTDYTAPATFSIPQGASTATLDFTLIDDTAVEGNETVVATISAPSTGSIGTATATANLADNDTYTVSIAKTTDGAEPSTNGQFTVTLSPANTTGLPITGTVTYSGTATNGTDYTAPATFSIPQGASTAALNFTPIDDTAVEGTETVIATISAPSTGSIGTAAATANLADNDTVSYTLSIVKTTDGAEPSTNGQFTVTVSPTNTTGSAITGTVAYSGTATKGTDYNAPVTFSIPQGASTAALNFTPIDDTAVEGTETIIAALALTSAASSSRVSAELINLGNASASASISDDDTGTPIPIFSPFGLLTLLVGLVWFGWRRKS